MLILTLLVASLAMPPQAQKAPPKKGAASSACMLLSAQEIGTLVGAARAVPIMSSAGGSACMYQNEDKFVNVLIANLSSDEAAKGQWEAKKRVSGGKDVAGWPVPAYSSAVEKPKQHSAIVGIVKGRMFVEVTVTDVARPASVLQTALQSLMKTVSGRI
jgi:hypothetical protein